MRNNLLEEIETIRSQMVKLAMNKNSLTDTEVVVVSQKLDKLLNLFYKQK